MSTTWMGTSKRPELPKATRRQFMKRVNELGCTVDEDSIYSFLVDCPKGKVFKGEGLHTLVGHFMNTSGQSWKAEVYADAIQRMSMGLEDCDDPECDYCHGEEE